MQVSIDYDELEIVEVDYATVEIIEISRVNDLSVDFLNANATYQFFVDHWAQF